MRIRTVKPEFWSHPIMSRLPDDARLLALGLLSIADDEGYFLADPALLRSSIWPFDEDSTRARRTLAQCSAAGWCGLREHPTHGQIGFVENFTKHQRIDRPSPSKLKGYFLDERSTNVRRTLAAGTGNREQGSREQGKESPAAVAAPPEEPKANGDHSRLCREFSEGFEKRFGSKYRFTGGRDGKAAKALLEAGRTVEEVMDLAERAWNSSSMFNCKQAASLHGLCDRWNEITVELKTPVNGQAPPQPRKYTDNLDDL